MGGDIVSRVQSALGAIIDHPALKDCRSGLSFVGAALLVLCIAGPVRDAIGDHPPTRIVIEAISGLATLVLVFVAFRVRRVLWACRVSVASAIFGFLLFSNAVPAQNIFADTSLNGNLAYAAGYWFLVFAALFFFWAFPVHYGARWTLGDPPGSKSKDPSRQEGDGASGTDPKQDAWLVSPSVRQKLDANDLDELYAELRESHACAIEWVPRLLGVVPFIAFLIAILHALVTQVQAEGFHKGEATQTQLWILVFVDIAAAAAFCWFVYIRRGLLAGLPAWASELPFKRNLWGSVAATLTIAGLVYWGFLFPSCFTHVLLVMISLGALVYAVDWFQRKMRDTDTKATDADELAHLKFFVTAFVFALAFVDPLCAADGFPRALLMPFLLGGLVLVGSSIQRQANFDGYPWIALTVGMALLVTALNGGFNDLRTLPIDQRSAEPQRADGSPRQIGVREAVGRWMAANDCPDAPRSCPPALVIAIDGGASRAAFTAATFIGEILDRTGGTPDRARRIFAISGVSGGSLGAVAIRTALAKAVDDPEGRPPCRNAHRTYFRYEQFSGGKRDFSWRECLQALVSGDYLTPVFVGLGLRDNFAPPMLMRDDRAALLEQAFERNYEYVLGKPANGELALQQPFGYLPNADTGKSSGATKRWLPLLLLNATSVQTGRRVVVSDLLSTYLDPNDHPDTKNPPLGLYSQAYDLFETMSSPCKTPNHKDRSCPAAFAESTPSEALDAPDVRLSTAAVASARFPIISPAGATSVKGASAFGDRLVDGGYFENSGDTTALDLAEALRKFGLEPIILSISNDPERRNIDAAVPPRPVVTPLVPVSDNDVLARLLGIFSAPLQTLLNTRDGHGAEAKDLAVRTLADRERTTCRRLCLEDCARSTQPSCAAACATSCTTKHPTSTFFSLGISAEPDLAKAALDDDSHERICTDVWQEAARYDEDQCKDIWTTRKSNVSKIALSWWLSRSLQEELDMQRCSKENRMTLRDLMCHLRSKPQLSR